MCLEDKIQEFKQMAITRDYLLKTKFIGELKDRKLVSELKSSTFNGYGFKEIIQQIQRFDFSNLDDFLYALNEKEEINEILDFYRPRKTKTKYKKGVKGKKSNE